MLRWIHVRTAALLIVTLGVLAGCSNPLSNEPSSQPAQDRAGRLLDAGETKAALPAVASLPVGWAPAAKNLLRPKDTKDKLTPTRCQALDHGLDLGFLRAATKSYRTYVSPGKAMLGVGIASHSETPPAFGAVRAALRTCRSFQLVEGATVTRVKVLPLRLPGIARDMVVARFLMRQGATTATYDVVRVRVGHNEIRADLVTPSPGKPRTRPLETAVRNVLLNLS